MLLAWGIFLFAQGIYNDGAHIVSSSGSYWVVDNGDFTLTSSSATDPTQFDNLKIEADASLVLGSASTPAYLTVDGNLAITSGGSFTVKSGTGGTGSLILNGTSDNITVERYLTANKWHYISEQTNVTEDFSTVMGLGDPGTSTNSFYRWDESFMYDGVPGTWIDILHGPNGGGTNNEMDETFLACRGYAITYVTTDKTLSLTGAPFLENKTINITNSGVRLNAGSNLVGNPFSSNIAINLDAQEENFITQNSSVLKDEAQAVYFWDDIQNDYVTKSNGSEEEVYAEPGQGFMILAKNASESLMFNVNIRKHGASTFYKATEDQGNSLIELTVRGSENRINKTTVAFIQGMTDGLDPSYDAMKFKGNPNIALYTRLVEDNGVDFAIQALPTESMENSVIPIGMDVAEAAEIHFSIYQNGMDETNIRLEDRQNGIFTDLKSNEYSTLVSESGTGRFFLHIGNTTAVEEINGNAVQVYMAGGNIIIQSEQQPKRITLTDITGRTLGVWENVESIPAPSSTGVYLVTVETDHNRITKKIIVE